MYLIGSAALGGYVPGRSDLDVVAVCAGRLDPGTKRALADALSHGSIPCPAERLEFTLFSREVVRRPGAVPSFELNLDTGPAGDEARYDATASRAHWFVLDLEMCRRFGRPLAGRAPDALIGPVPDDVVARALRDQLEWYRRNEPDTHHAVFAACRAWRWAEDGALGSKDEAAEWAVRRWPDAALVERAAAVRRGRAEGPLEKARVLALLDRAVGALGTRRSPPTMAGP